MISADAALVAVDDMVPSFQPVVELGTGRMVGVEALARWPTVADVDPAEVFALARLRGVVSDFDFACRTAAVNEARSARLTEGLALYLNFEPSGIVDPARTEEHLDALDCGVDVVLEITERGLGTDPEGLVSMVASARRRGFRIALDDVGSNPGTVRALPLVRPDILKLDSWILRHPRSIRARKVMWAVRSHIAATGATLLAEGIESAQDREDALRLGATLGQGWLYGAAGPARGITAREAIAREATGVGSQRNSSA